jgi:hypothetical protein
MRIKKQLETFVVEKIIKHRMHKRLAGTTFYEHIEILVKWEGYSLADNTWEPLTSIYKDIAALCRRYFREKGFTLECK